jgi:hypothetical protein
LIIGAELGVRLLDVFVGVGLGEVDVRLGDVRHRRLNTASTACAPFGSIRPVVENMGIVFLSAASVARMERSAIRDHRSRISLRFMRATIL